MEARPLRDLTESNTTTAEQGGAPAGGRLLPELCRDLKIAPLSGAELVDQAKKGDQEGMASGAQ